MKVILSIGLTIFLLVVMFRPEFALLVGGLLAFVPWIFWRARESKDR